MTDHTPLTDEELAAIKAQWKAALNANIQSGDPLIRTPFAHIPRLVAALRAERAGNNDMWRRNNELQAEVERLKVENAQLKKWIPSGW